MKTYYSKIALADRDKFKSLLSQEGITAKFVPQNDLLKFNDVTEEEHQTIQSISKSLYIPKDIDEEADTLKTYWEESGRPE